MKTSIQRRLFLVANNLFLLLLLITMIYPMLYVVFASFSDSYELMRHQGLLLWPMKANVQAYLKVLQNKDIFTGYLNTIFIVGVGTGINMIMSILAAFFFSHKGMMLKKPLMLMVIFTMYFGGGMIPNYLLIKGLGLIDSLWSLLLPGAVGTYNMIILKRGFEALPASLEESAMLDGASYITVMLRIAVPLSLSTIAVIILYYAVGHWNSWFNASIYLKTRAKFPLQLILREILISNDTSSMDTAVSYEEKAVVSETIKYAIIVVSTVPILCIYPFLQKYFIQGVMTGAVKE